MAEKLSITIALNGAEEIKRQLADVGKAGQDCFKDINDAAADVGGFNKLDPSVVTEKLKATGVAGKDVAKVLTAVNQAGRMETLVNGIAAVENGLVKVQTAASALDAVLLKGVVRSLSIVARALPAAFAAATVGAIANTVNQLKELDAAAVKAGISIGEMAKAREIFKAIGLSGKAAADAVSGFLNNLEQVKAAAAVLDEFGTSTEAGVKALRVLQQALLGGGEAAEIAYKTLLKIGQLQLSQPAADIDRIKESSLSASQQLLAIIGILEKMGPTAERNRLAEKLLGPEFSQALRAGGVELEALKQKLLELSVPSQQAADQAIKVGLEWQKLKNLLGSGFTVNVEGLQAVNALLNLISVTLTTIGTKLSEFNFITGSLNMGNTMRELEFIGGLLTQIGNIGVTIWNNIKQSAAIAWQEIIGWINMAIEAIKKFFGMSSSAATDAGKQAGEKFSAGFQQAIEPRPGIDNVPGNIFPGSAATGGLLGGRGTGTSDSNLMWLSRGEHVMPARAVRQPGVLSLLEALRRSGGNMRSVLDRMGHFAQGGIVGGAGMSHVTIAFPGLPPVGGLRASSSVVEELRRAAGMAQVRSGGRKPSRYF